MWTFGNLGEGAYAPFAPPPPPAYGPGVCVCVCVCVCVNSDLVHGLFLILTLTRPSEEIITNPYPLIC